MTDLHPDLEKQKHEALQEEAKTGKVEHAQAFLESQLRLNNGPWDKSSTVITILALPQLDEKGVWNGNWHYGYGLLRDMDWDVLMDGLDGLKAMAEQAKARDEEGGADVGKSN